MRHKVLNARGFKRNDVLFREKTEKKERLTFNLIYHPAFQSLNKTLRKVQVILNFDPAHREVFAETPILGFRNGKSLKDMLVRAKVPPIQNEKGKCEGCSGKRCGVCAHIKECSEFTDKNGKSYNIRHLSLNCNSKNVVYVLNCKTCKAQYVGSCITKFRLRFNNYRSCNNNHKIKTGPKQSLHSHFDEPGHNGFNDWQFILIDQGDSETSVRKRERFWQYKLSTFLPNGLNDCEVFVPT